MQTKGSQVLRNPKHVYSHSLCQGSFVLNFVVIRNIHFIIIFLNDIIDILFHFQYLYSYIYFRSGTAQIWFSSTLLTKYIFCPLKYIFG